MCIEHRRRRRRWLPIPPPSSEMNDIYYIGMAQESLVFDVRPRKRRESFVEMEIAVHLTFARLLLQTEMNSFACLSRIFTVVFARYITIHINTEYVDMSSVYDSNYKLLIYYVFYDH